ncbi:MAG: Rieske 2Fe-2S domain-containing protein [Proteobacteria bacterium]|nr:Rieske 2Fe-2S domain-containing protein [Pseudomonadota bacterium]
MERILVIYGFDGQFHAFRNRCPHMGRRLEPIVGSVAVQCCSLSRSTFDYAGNVMSGPAKESLRKHCVETKKCKVIIWLE